MCYNIHHFQAILAINKSQKLVKKNSKYYK